MAEKSSSSSSSGIDKELEGEPIITWTCDVLKECLRSQGGRLTGKKMPRLEADRSLGDERLVCHLGWKFTPLGFYRAIFCHTNPETATTLAKFCFWTLRGRRQDNEVGPTALARLHHLYRLSYPLMVHILPICIPSRQLYEKLFRGGVAISNKKKLSQFLLKKKKLVWFCEWAIIIMPGCSWNFFSELFCEMHAVVTVKTVVNFNDANIFCTICNKEQSKVPTVCHDHKPFTKKPKVSLKQKSERQRQCSWMWRKKFFKRKHDACESTIRISKHERS